MTWNYALPEHHVVVGYTYDDAHHTAREKGLIDRRAVGDVILTLVATTAASGVVARGSLLGARILEENVTWTERAHRGPRAEEVRAVLGTVCMRAAARG